MSQPADDAARRTLATEPEGVDRLGAQTARGLKWTSAGLVLTAVMQLVYTAVMSRLLVPEQFGIFAIASLTVQFAQYFAQMGVGQAVIQKPTLDEADVRAAWTSSVLLGLAFTVLFWFAAPSVARIFNEPDSIDVLRVMGLTFFVVGLGNTAASLLRRRLHFRQLTIASTGAFFVGFLVVGIPLAVAGLGVWSLVWGNLASHLVGSALKYRWARHSLRPHFGKEPYRHLYAFGARSSLGQFTEFLGNNLDTLVVGRYATSALLGQYNRAFYLVNLPLGYLVRSLSQVLFPSFSRLQDDPERLRDVFVRAIATAGVLLVPLAAGLGVAAVDVVEAILGPQWDDAAAVVPLLAVAASGRVMTRFAAIAAEARARLNLRLAIQFGHLGLLVGLLAVAAGGPLWHYALALTVAEVVRHVAYLLAMRTITGVTPRQVAGAYGPVAFTTVVVAGLIAGARLGGVGVGLGPVALLALEGLAGLVGLVLSLRFGPLGLVRRELRHRLSAGQLVGRDERLVRVVGLVLGPAATS